MKKDNQKPRKGRCTNFLNCPLADNENVQEVQPGNDFKCSHCGLDLEEINDKPQRNLLLWALLIIALITIAVLFSVQRCRRDVYPILNDTIVNECGDTIIMKGLDTLSVYLNTRIDTIFNSEGDAFVLNGCRDTINIIVKERKPNNEDPKPKVPENGPKAPEKQIAPAYGEYFGNRDENGEPHGTGGSVTITTEYHCKNHVFSKGDVIENTTYEHGVLKHGKVRKNGGVIEF